jgi:hypothetical protein
LFTITTFQFFEDKDFHLGFDCYILSTSLWITIESQELEYNTKLKLNDTSFKLVQTLANQDFSCQVSHLEISEWEDLSEVPTKERTKIANTFRIYCLVKDHQELGTPGKTGKYYG